MLRVFWRVFSLVEERRVREEVCAGGNRAVSPEEKSWVYMQYKETKKEIKLGVSFFPLSTAGGEGKKRRQGNAAGWTVL